MTARKAHSGTHSNTEGVAVKRALLDLQGANCTSCAIAIEHIGRRLDGVTEIRVDRANSVIHVAYGGDAAVLDKLCDFVRHIGYSATIRSANIDAVTNASADTNADAVTDDR